MTKLVSFLMALFFALNAAYSEETISITAEGHAFRRPGNYRLSPSASLEELFQKAILLRNSNGIIYVTRIVDGKKTTTGVESDETSFKLQEGDVVLAKAISDR